MGALRLFLLSGLIFHKVLWEVLKKRAPVTRPQHDASVNLIKIVVKAVKAMALAFLIFQTLFFDILPISEKPAGLRVAGTLIFVAGLFMAVLGRLHLGKNWVDLEDSHVLPDQSLTTSGIYAYIRHPIYAGGLLLLIGLQLALNSWLVLAVVIPLVVVIRQVVTEESLLSSVIPGYESYCKRTKRFIPFVV